MLVLLSRFIQYKITKITYGDILTQNKIPRSYKFTFAAELTGYCYYNTSKKNKKYNNNKEQ